MNAKQALVRRYRYLWTGELVAAAAFLLLFLIYVPLEQPWPSWILRVYGLAILLFLLGQGAFWWRGLLLDIQAHRRNPTLATLRVFERLRRINWVAIAGFPLLAVWRATASEPTSTADLGWGIALATAALIEQINYYHYQLSYGYGQDLWYLRRHRRLRRGNIARHLDAARKAPGAKRHIP